jgi:hypothetical protein
LAVVPLVASAQGNETSSTIVTAKPASTTTGHPLTLVAQITGVTDNATRPTGTVAFSITGHDSTTVNCKTSNTETIKHGKAVCKVLGGQLQAVSSPYTVLATYSGDTIFAGSVGGTSVNVTKANTHTSLKMGPGRPHSGTPDAVTATVRTGHGGNLLSGTVTFSVSSVPVTGKTICTNDNGSGKKGTFDTQPLSVSGNVGTAVCDLQPGWFVISKVGPGNKHPHGAWNARASYAGNGNFLPSTGMKGGHSKT